MTPTRNRRPTTPHPLPMPALAPVERPVVPASIGTIEVDIGVFRLVGELIGKVDGEFIADVDESAIMLVDVGNSSIVKLALLNSTVWLETTNSNVGLKTRSKVDTNIAFSGIVQLYDSFVFPHWSKYVQLDGGESPNTNNPVSV